MVMGTLARKDLPYYQCLEAQKSFFEKETYEKSK